MKEGNAMTPQTQNSPKKPYAAPQVLVYGDIREITKHGGSRSPDGTQSNKTGT